MRDENSETILLILLLNILINRSDELSCRGESGDRLDWFIVYKIPKLEKSSSDLLKSGYGYAYITNASVNGGDWTLSDKLITSKDSMFGQTIAPIFSNTISKSVNTSLVVYNDQPPGLNPSFSSAHAKGVFAISSDGAFWLIHSIPNFPSLNTSYSFPSSARHNGQTAICISLAFSDFNSIDNIAIQLLYMRPNLYKTTIRNSLIAVAPHWNDLLRKKWIKTANNSHLNIKSQSGMVFDSFAKSNAFANDLYSALIAPTFKVDLLVQSWRNGAGDPLDSDCDDKYTVQNVEKIKFLVNDDSDDIDDWNYTEDHSKWLVSIANTSGKQYVCIADINRMKSQFKRGGGSVCLKSNQVWKLFKGLVESIEGCHIKFNRNLTSKLTTIKNSGVRKQKVFILLNLFLTFCLIFLK